MIVPLLFRHLTADAWLLFGTDADALVCRRGPAAAVQHQPDGRADAAIVRDGGGAPEEPALIDAPFFIAGVLKSA